MKCKELNKNLLKHEVILINSIEVQLKYIYVKVRSIIKNTNYIF